ACEIAQGTRQRSASSLPIGVGHDNRSRDPGLLTQFCSYRVQFSSPISPAIAGQPPFDECELARKRRLATVLQFSQCCAHQKPSRDLLEDRLNRSIIRPAE